MNILKILLSMLASQKVNTGVLDDKRSDAEKLKDYLWSEVGVTTGAGFNVSLLPKIPKKFKLRDQNGSGSCVSQSCAKMLEVLDTQSDEAWSATPIYSKRLNRPQRGMVGYDALSICTKQGSAYEKDIVSQFMNDEQMDNLSWGTNNLQKNKPSNYYIISDKNGNVKFQDLVDAIMANKTAVIYVNASVSQWTRVSKVHNSDGSLRHGLACVDVIQYNNIPYVVIEDSWGVLNKYYNQIDLENQGLIEILGDGQRALSKEFIENHCYFAGGLVNFVYENTTRSLHYKFGTILEFGQRDTAGQSDIKELQNRLKELGLFPNNIPSSGYYGSLTAKAVYAFQIKYNVAPINELDTLKGRRVGMKTIEKLNNI